MRFHPRIGKGQWQFEGGAFHESLPEGRSAGTLEVSPVSVKFVSEAGTVEMPVSGLQMELGGAANRMLFLKHSEHPDWTFFTTDHALMEHPVFTKDARTAAAAGICAHARHRL